MRTCMYTDRITIENVFVFMGVFSWAWFCGSMFFLVCQFSVCMQIITKLFFCCSNVLHVMMWIVAIRRLEVSTSSLRRYVSADCIRLGVHGDCVLISASNWCASQYWHVWNTCWCVWGACAVLPLYQCVHCRLRTVGGGIFADICHVLGGRLGVAFVSIGCFS